MNDRSVAPDHVTESPAPARLEGDLPGGSDRLRLLRAGVRVAGLGRVVFSSLSRIRRIRRERDEGTRARARIRAFREGSLEFLAVHGIEVVAQGPAIPEKSILVSNHVSWLDPLVVAAHVPCVPVSKADVEQWPVVGSIARDLGVVFVSRGDAGSGASALRSVRAVLDAGHCVLNFPEGTTSEGDDVLPFRPGMFGLALRAEAPIVPVAIRYEPRNLAWVGDATFVPHYLSLASLRRARAIVRIGAPLRTPADCSPRKIAEEARDRVAALLKEG